MKRCIVCSQKKVMKKQLLIYTLAFAKEQSEIFSVDFHPDGTKFLTTTGFQSIFHFFAG